MVWPGFESVRAVFRLANALSQAGFTQFVFVKGKGLCDLKAMKGDQPWFIEVKTLVLQTRPQEFNVNGVTEILVVDKFQPKTNGIADYVETVSRQIAGNLIGKARDQLMETVKKEGAAKKMIALVLNLFAADVFLDASNLFGVHTRPRGELGDEWAKNYLVDVDTLAFLTDHRSPLRVLRTKVIATVLPSPRDLAGTETVQTEIRARPVRSNAATH